MSSQTLASILVSALVLGSLYALIASGLSLIWSTLKVFNFAHGVLLALAAYIGWTLMTDEGLPFAAAIFLTLIIMMLLSVPFAAVFVAPFIRRKNGDLMVMVATFAATMAIQNGLQLVWGTDLKQIPSPGTGTVRLLGQNVGWAQVIAMASAPILLPAVWYVLRRSTLGLAVRAVEQNREFAQLVGIRPQVVYLLTIGVAVGLASIAGVLLGSIQFVTPQLGADPLLKAFVVVVFGGLASLSGTIIAAYIIGALESITTFYIGLYWSPVVVLGVLVVVLLVRPEGLVRHREATV